MYFIILEINDFKGEKCLLMFVINNKLVYHDFK